MKAVVLCPGPSLRKFEKPDAYRLIVGVNRAAQFTPCDIWVALDARTFGETKALGRPVLVTATDQYEIMCKQHAKARKLEHRSSADLSFPRTPVAWHTKGLTTAIVVAYLQGAREIDCWGVDWSGVADWDGRALPTQKRSPKRWREEEDLFSDLIDLLSNGDENCMIRRIGQNG